MPSFKSISTILTSLSCSLLIACGGGGGSGDGGGSPAIEGNFLDSAVEGVSYVAGSRSGETSATGGFLYSEGDRVFFSIGDIDLGDGIARKSFTPLSIVGTANPSDDRVINIARFLQTIDNNGNPDDGIFITQAVRDLAVGESINFAQTKTGFEEDPNVIMVIEKLTGGSRELITSTAAEEHLRSTLASLLAEARAGFDGTLNFTTTNCSDPNFNINERFQGSFYIHSSSLTENGLVILSSGTFFLNVGQNLLEIDLSFPSNINNIISFNGDMNVSGTFTFSLDFTQLMRVPYTFTGSFDKDTIRMVVPGRSNVPVTETVNCDFPAAEYVFTKLPDDI